MENLKGKQFVQEIDRAGKPVAVICHGPWLLISAGLMKLSIRDRNWLSSRKPDDLPVFNKEMLSLFEGSSRSTRGSDVDRREANSDRR